MKRLQVLLLSTTEGLQVAQAIKDALDSSYSCTLWSDDEVFSLSATAIEALEHATDCYDTVVVVATADDVVTLRNVAMRQIRDNLIFELGLFAGSLGRENVYLVLDAAAWEGTHIPSDLGGVTFATFDSTTISGDPASVTSAVRGAVRRIRTNIKASAAFAAAGVKRISIIGATSDDPAVSRAIEKFMVSLLLHCERNDWGINSCGQAPVRCAAFEFARRRFEHLKRDEMFMFNNRVWWFWRSGGGGGLNHHPPLFRSTYFHDRSSRRLAEAQCSDAILVFAGREGTASYLSAISHNVELRDATKSKAVIPLGWFGGATADFIRSVSHKSIGENVIRDRSLRHEVETWTDAAIFESASKVVTVLQRYI